MASVVNRPDGHKWVQFKGHDGKRKSIRLGEVNGTVAKEFKRRVEELLSTRLLGHSPGHDLAMWIKSLAPAMQQRLAKLGLITSQPPKAQRTLLELIEAHKKAMNISDGTKVTINCVYENLKKFFPSDRLLKSITPADADEFRGWLTDNGRHKPGEPLAPTTSSRQCKRAKQIFEFATSKKHWLKRNPFAHMTGWKDTNRERDFHISTDLAKSILSASTSAEFRAIFALARGAGMRCPSEITKFRWEWVDWENSWLRVRVPKNRRYEGREMRDVPMFPVVRQYLTELFEQADAGQELLFPKHQVSGTAITNELQRVCRSIGVPLWEKPWVNLRGSCETDMLERFPVPVVAAWIGHSPRVMIKHYAQIVKEHHARAIAGEFTSPFASPDLVEDKAK